jgi:uncharacterized protein (DUF362 family)
MTRVSVTRTPPAPDFDQIRASVEEAIDLIGGMRQLVNPGQRVMVKPNLVTAVTEPERAAITLPEVSRAVADLVKAAGAAAIIADSADVGSDTEEVIAGSGYADLREKGYSVVDLKKTGTIRVPLKEGRLFTELEMYGLAAEVDLVISVAKMKTHDQMELTLAIKNLKGLISDRYKKLPRSVSLFTGPAALRGRRRHLLPGGIGTCLRPDGGDGCDRRGP